MSIKFEFLPNAGEAILITIDNSFTILIDGGYSHPFKKEFSRKRKSIPKIDMVIVTHIDRDHIGGVVDIFKDQNYLNNIKYLIFNEPERCNLFHRPHKTNNVSASDGNSLLKLLEKNENIRYIKSTYFQNTEVEEKINHIVQNVTIKVLSPNKQVLDELLSVWNPDKFKIRTDVCDNLMDNQTDDIKALAQQDYELDGKIPNKSSIAFLLTYESRNFLLLGDAHITQVNEALKVLGYSTENPIHLDLVKLSHHGSIKNINKEFLDLIRTDKYIICPCKKLPNKETIAKIALYGKTKGEKHIKNIFVTKPIKFKFSESEYNHFQFQINYLDELEFSDDN
ncbi:MAG: hypothetical protein RI964_613 [Pseudomonadota bacterium]|jgi:beta-lactamase superfamily II metal-dependent hydrolase